MSDIYSQHDAAFNRVSAYVILKGGERVATIALKFPADGAGRLFAYVHWISLPMTRGYAGGYGYDKRSAALSVACKAAHPAEIAPMPSEREIDGMHQFNRFKAALNSMSGDGWERALETAGFTVLQAV